MDNNEENNLNIFEKLQLDEKQTNIPDDKSNSPLLS
jgi:hypothetical protein